MTLTTEQIRAALARPDLPRSFQYDPHLILENQMGPNPIWLTEWLTQAMDLKPGMRVLDLGCGRGLSSIFLAKEFGLSVFATDLWIGATENRVRFEQAGVADRVFPIHIDAHQLPYAEQFFDAMLCVDAYIYFGTDDLYLDYFHKFVKPGGQIGIVVPGFMKELEGPLPEHLIPFWAQECWTWHTIQWWRNLWERTGLVEIETADIYPNGAQAWLQWERTRQQAGDDSESLKTDIRVLESDDGQYMGWARLVARRKD